MADITEEELKQAVLRSWKLRSGSMGAVHLKCRHCKAPEIVVMSSEEEEAFFHQLGCIVKRIQDEANNDRQG